MSRSFQNLNNPNPIPNVLPSKRKLDDYAPPSSPSSPGEYESLVATARCQSQFNTTLFSRNHNPNPNPEADQSRVRNSPPSATSSSSSSGSSPLWSPSMIQFFVRTTDSKTLVFHASLHSTVSSLLSRLSGASVPSSDLRFICNGRQLDADSTLEDSKVERDSTLHLSARLRSTRFPHSCRLVCDLLYSCSILASGLPLPLYAKNPAALILDFLADPYPKKEPFDADAASEKAQQHFRIFLDAAAPAALIKLYLSNQPGCSIAAERAVLLLLKPELDVSPRNLEMLRAPVILDLSKLLAAYAGPDDHLYLKCRSALAPLAESISKNGLPKLAEQLFPFVSELAGVITKGLSTDPVFVSPDEIAEFAGFLVGIRRAIANVGPIPKSLLEDQRHPMYASWISSLYAVFVKLLTKVDECLVKVASFIDAKIPVVHGEIVLTVLTYVHKFSKIYEGGHELLHGVLCSRKDSVNVLIRRAKRNEKLKWLLRHKDVTDFEARQSLALMLFPEGKDDFDRLHEMLIDRSQLLAESFEYIGRVEAHSLHGGLFMEFKNEEATGPGVLREWFCLVCQAIFNPQNVLFLSCPNDQRRFFPNPASAVDPLHLKYFGFCGRLIALALMHKVQVGVVFDRVFYFQLAGKPITLEDIKDADPCLYMSCKKILEMDAELLDSDILGLTFVREIEEMGIRRAVELCSEGKDIIVNSNNRETYINLLIQHQFVTSTSEQVSRFAWGFSDILSRSKLWKFFFLSLDLQDFDRMLGGSDGSINVNDWRAHTEYSGYKGKDRVINWFWKIVGGMSEEQQRILLFFWTSVKYLPVDGFSGLASKLYIYKASDSHDRLPTSHTCFYRLCLPQYPSISTMRDRLQFITQEHVSCTFGMW